MEQKRTLWILIAAGLFLCAVFGFAYLMSGTNSKKNTTAISLKNDPSSIWLSPSDSVKPAEKKEEPTYTNTAVVKEDEQVKAPGLRDGLSSSEEGVPTVTASDAIAQTDNLTVIANGPTNVYVPESTETVNANGSTTTTFDFSSYSNAYSSSNVKAANKAGEDAIKNKETAKTAKTLDESTTKKSATTTAKKTETKTAEKKAETKTTTAIPDRYWVQAASYSSKNKAEEARSILDENKIQCEVFTFDSNGTLYYRVRVGPYSTKDEATYWKKQVDGIALFAEAGTYIVNSSAPLAKK